MVAVVNEGANGAGEGQDRMPGQMPGEDFLQDFEPPLAAHGEGAGHVGGEDGRDEDGEDVEDEDEDEEEEEVAVSSLSQSFDTKANALACVASSRTST